MNYKKEFLKRGLIFGNLGPLVFGIVIMIIGFVKGINLAGWQILLAIVSSYLLAFVQAGSSVFEQVEEWSTLKKLSIHLLSIYLAYTITYLANNWIPYNLIVILVFSASVVFVFLVIWLCCYLAVNNTKKKLNKKLEG